MQLLEEEFSKVLPKSFDFPKLSKRLVSLAKTHSLSSRTITVTNDKLLKKTEKLKLATRNSTGVFSQILYNTRRSMKHRGIEMPKPGGREWLDVKEICKLATDFCNEFQLPAKEGYKIYCKMGLQKMKSFSIYKFKSLHNAIFAGYECQHEIETDPHPQQTDKLVKFYLKLVNDKIGWVNEDYTSTPEKYVGFVRACKEARVIGIDIDTYIKAQFAGLEWASGIPDPLQLYGVKAKERLMKYCFENNIMIKNKEKKIDFKKIQQKHNG